VRCDEALDTDGVLARLWPQVEGEQVAADRRRGPRQARPDPVTWPARDVADWVETIRPAINGAPPELMIRLRDLVNDLVPAGARGG
jgi:hypothetical protein